MSGRRIWRKCCRNIEEVGFILFYLGERVGVDRKRLVGRVICSSLSGKCIFSLGKVMSKFVEAGEYGGCFRGCIKWWLVG